MDGVRSRQDVEGQIRIIQTQMPETYTSIQAKSAEIGRQAFAMVRRACAGEPNCFWAMERGHVVGTPFNQHDIKQDLAVAMVAFGAKFAVVWSQAAATKASDGTA